MPWGMPKHWVEDEWKSLIGNDWKPPEPSSDEKLWRYRSLGQYVTFLDQKSLWFNRSDQFDDPYEGSLPKLNAQDRNKKFGDHKSKVISSFLQVNRYMSFLNCWHKSDHESNAMWKMYTNHRGVAIITTPLKLKKAIESADEIVSGEVNYVDYKHEKISDNSIISPFFHKRLGFKHEREYRLLYQNASESIEGDISIDEILTYQDSGVPISVDIDTLVDKVLVAPAAPSWLEETVRSVTQKYGYGFEVEPSKMGGKPQF